MVKLQFSGIYKTARGIPPLQLMEYYLAGDQSERKEAGDEILRRLSESWALKLVEVDTLDTDEFCEGEQARISGLSLRDNPYKDFQNKSCRRWERGWCDRDMILGQKNRKDVGE